MPNYRRSQARGPSWFFTINLQQREQNDLLVREIDRLKSVVRQVKAERPFRIDAWVILPEHMHCVWTLPEGDGDFSTRIRLMKKLFAMGLPNLEPRTATNQKRGERGIWQKRFWEHLIRNDDDFRRHVDYVHYNPMKHGWVSRVQDWPYSTFHRAVESGIYPPDWCGREGSGTVTPFRHGS